MKRALIGAGGYSHDLIGMMGPLPRFVDHKYWKPNREDIYPLGSFNPEEYEVVVAIADPAARQAVVERLPIGTRFFSYIHPSAYLFGPASIGAGSVVGAGSILMYGATIGNHCIVNVNVVLGHDCRTGDFFTIAPLAGVMGNCTIGNRVEFGAGACQRPKTRICDDVTIGMMAGVTGDITEPGIYTGIPARRRL